MITQIHIALASALLSQVLTDYHTDQSGQSAAYTNYNTYYPDYGYAYNNTLATYNKPTRRLFSDELDLGASIYLAFSARIPVTDLGTAVKISIPFSFAFPTSSSRSTTGRSLSTLDTSRSTLYQHVEGFVGQITKADGHACLLRAMCEASATPLHDEGILGDAVNFLLTGVYAAEEADDKFKTYIGAQAKGQLSGDCSKFNMKCPISFFKLIENNLV